MGRALAPLVVLLLAVPIIAGCMSDTAPAPIVTEHTWRVGDSWTYARTLDGGTPFLYTREVTGLFAKDGYEVFELKEGIDGHPIHQRSLYTVDDLRFFGFEVREHQTLRHMMAPTEPLPFHYVFPLEPGTERTLEGTMRQRSGNLSQEEPVRVTARVEAPRPLVLGERVYDVHPYRIDIRFLATPFDDGATIEGHWSHAVGQSVLTQVTQGGQVTRYELVSFERDLPAIGAPAYTLTGGLASHVLDRGFTAAIDTPGYARWLFHVTAPTTVGLRFERPAGIADDTRHRFDLIAIRPVGTTGAWLMRDADALDGGGLAFHMWAAEPGGKGHEFHSPRDHDVVTLRPGQVYELVVASNHGGASVTIDTGAEARARAAAQGGKVDIVKIAHRHVQETTLPGPQSVRDRESAVVALPAGERIEGLVFAMNHGGEALGEVGATRHVGLAVEDILVHDAAALYAVYLSHPAGAPFEVEVSYEYRADMALQGAVDYELGVFLMRLVPH